MRDYAKTDSNHQRLYTGASGGRGGGGDRGDHESSSQWEPKRAALTGDQYLTNREEYARKQTPTVGEAESKINQAVTWRKYESADGLLGALFVTKDAKENGISNATLTRAKTRLGCLSCKTSFAGIWTCKLPGEDFPAERRESERYGKTVGLRRLVRTLRCFFDL